MIRTAPIYLGVAILAACGLVCAEPGTAGGQGWTGTIGAGPIVFPKYTGGTGTRVLPAPLLSVNYNDAFYVELLRAGIYLLSSEDKKKGLGLAIEPRFGFNSTDGARLAGMATRRTSLEGGPSFDWDLDWLAINLAWFADLSGASRGNSLRATLYRQLLKDARWDLGVFLGADRMNGKVVNYYFGVPLTEATAARPFYRPGASTNYNLGVSGTVKLDQRHVIMFGANWTSLGRSAANSPIAETRRSNIYYIGLGWSL